MSVQDWCRTSDGLAYLLVTETFLQYQRQGHFAENRMISGPFELETWDSQGKVPSQSRKFSYTYNLVASAEGGLIALLTRSPPSKTGEPGKRHFIEIIRTSDLKTAHKIEYKPDLAAKMQLALSPNGERIAFVGHVVVKEEDEEKSYRSRAPFVPITVMSPDKSRHQTFEVEGLVDALAFSPDGKHLIVGVGLCTAPLEEIPHVDGVTVLSTGGWKLGFSEDGRYLATACPNRIRIWDLETREHLAELYGPTEPLDIAFNKGRTRLHTVSKEGEVHTWNRRRPEYAWGVVVLPELWLTALLAAALMWSLMRDHKGLGATAVPGAIR